MEEDRLSKWMREKINALTMEMIEYMWTLVEGNQKLEDEWADMGGLLAYQTLDLQNKLFATYKTWLSLVRGDNEDHNDA